MNVSEIRQRIFDQMDYFPDLQQYRDSVVRRINDRYQELCDSAHWLFLQKEDTITVRKEELGSSAKSIGITVTSANPRLATASGWTPLLQMEGQTLTNTDSGAEFKIIRVNGNSIFLGGDWDGTKGSVIYDWKITFQRFLLPEDCIEVLGYVDRAADRGKLLFIGRRREEFAYLDADNTGDPSTVVEDEHVLDDPPTTVLKGSTVATSAASNYLEQGTTYEYRYTIYREGRESPPSLVTSVLTPSVGNVDVLLENFEDTGWYSTAASVTSLNTGMEKLIYRRDKTNDGKWMLIGSISSITTSFTDDELLPKSLFTYQTSGTFRYASSREVLRWTDPGPRQYVRFWYTPSTDKKIHLRYHFRPKDLIADNDAPVLPRQYHTILVYLTLQDMFLQMQDAVQSQLFERRAELVKIQMRRRYLARDDQRKRMGRWDRTRKYKNMYGTPASDFSGP